MGRVFGASRGGASLGNLGSLRVNLELVNKKFDKNLKKVTKDVKQYPKTTNKALDKAGKAWKKHTALIGAAGLGVAGFGAVAVATFRSVVTEAATFQQSMVNTQAVVGATSDELQELTGFAREMGKQTVFSATESATAMNRLGSAGLDTQEIMDSLKGTLDLSAATQSDLASTSQTVASTLSQFGFAAEESGRIANVFAATISASQATMEKLSTSMSIVGPVAKAVGLDLEETAGILGSLFNAGLDASTAGTSLRQAMAQLLKPTDDAKEALQRLNVETLDSQGQLRSLTDIIRDLETTGLTAADALTIFGVRAGPGMLALVSQGADSIEELTAAVTDTDKAAEIAELQVGTFQGQMKLLNSAVSELKISIGDELLPVLTEYTTKLTGAINKTTDFAAGQPELGSAIKGLAEGAVRRAILADETALVLKIMGKEASVLRKATNALGITTDKAKEAAQAQAEALAEVQRGVAAVAGNVSRSGIILAKMGIQGEQANKVIQSTIGSQLQSSRIAIEAMGFQKSEIESIVKVERERLEASIIGSRKHTALLKRLEESVGDVSKAFGDLDKASSGASEGVKDAAVIMKESMDEVLAFTGKQSKEDRKRRDQDLKDAVAIPQTEAKEVIKARQKTADESMKIAKDGSVEFGKTQGVVRKEVDNTNRLMRTVTKEQIKSAEAVAEGAEEQRRAAAGMKQTASEIARIWDNTAGNIKASMSDLFATMIDPSIETDWKQLWDSLKSTAIRSLADIVASEAWRTVTQISANLFRKEGLTTKQVIDGADKIVTNSAAVTATSASVVASAAGVIAPIAAAAFVAGGVALVAGGGGQRVVSPAGELDPQFIKALRTGQSDATVDRFVQKLKDRAEAARRFIANQPQFRQQRLRQEAAAAGAGLPEPLTFTPRRPEGTDRFGRPIDDDEVSMAPAAPGQAGNVSFGDIIVNLPEGTDIRDLDSAAWERILRDNIQPAAEAIGLRFVRSDNLMAS